jgi:hypothetical protein
MNPSYNISKPCSEDWNKMTTEEQGRHCQVCCKTVVDFSKQSNEQIIGFLEKNATAKICGRFRKEQLQPHKVVKPFNRYRTFFAALILVFGGMLFSSCSSSNPKHEQLMGDVAYTPDTLKPQNNSDSAIKKVVIPDSVKKSGGMNIRKTNKPVIVSNLDTIPEPEHMMGDVAYTPDPKDTLK